MKGKENYVVTCRKGTL